MEKLVIILMIAQAYGNTLAAADVTTVVSLSRIVIGGGTCICKFGGSGIRSDYQHSPGIGYHKLHTRAKTWNKARKICIEEGGHLAIINSEAEASILREMLATETDIHGAAHKDHAYLGMHDFFDEGEWTTVLGEPLERAGYDHWYINEPNNLSPKEHCGAMGKHGGLLDFNCDLAYAFFCEIPNLR